MPLLVSGANQQDPQQQAECSNNNNNDRHNENSDNDDENDDDSNANAGVIEGLDPEVWQKLPHELLEKVHLCLPLRSVARFRLVCSAWNKIVFDAGFVRARERLFPPLKPWIVVTSTANSVAIYDTGTSTWLSIPLPFNASSQHVVATASGLLCFSTTWMQRPRMVVFNPVTNRHRHLPSINSFMIITVGMTYNDETKSYKILVCGRRHDHTMITEVYDSATDQWTAGDIPSAGQKYGGDSLVWLNGIFYCLTFPFSTLSLMAYDLDRSNWFEVPVAMPTPIMSPSVVVCGSKLLLVGGMDPEHEGLERYSIQIWEMDFGRCAWEEVESVPVAMCGQFERWMVSSKPLCAFGNGERVFLTIPNNNAFLTSLVYDLRDRSWNWWPVGEFPSDLPRVNAGRVFGTSFEPRLHARV